MGQYSSDGNHTDDLKINRVGALICIGVFLSTAVFLTLVVPYYYGLFG